MKTQRVLGALAVSATLAATATVFGGAHTWDIVEIFSNSDGTIQFVELMEQNGTPNEINLGGLQVTTDLNAFAFPANLPGGSSASKSILLGTAAYAALPGAVAPDHIIPANFFDINDDFLEYHVYDDFNPSAGQVPTDGKNSLHRLGPGATNLGPGPNSPKNFAGDEGSIDACPVDITGDGQVGIDEFLLVIGNWGTAGGDVTGDGNTDIDDFLAVLANWGPC